MIIPSLDGESIEDLSTRLLEKWGLGRKDVNNGVLLLVAMADRRARIEVGYGLEDRLTDALSRRILEDELFPAFRSRDYAGGIQATCDGIIAATRGVYAPRPRKPSAAPFLPAIGIPVIFIVIVIVLIVLRLQGGSGIGGGGRRRYYRSGPIWWGGGGGLGGGGFGGGGWGGGGGSGGFGGFSGGGGMSGGGGASGSW